MLSWDVYFFLQGKFNTWTILSQYFSMARDRKKKIHVNWIKNIIASEKRINTVILWFNLVKGFSAKERNKSQDHDVVIMMRVIMTELASYQNPYFLSCGGLCSNPDREVHLRNKQIFYSKQQSQDWAVLTFGIKILIRFSTDDWQLICVLVREL